MENNNDWFENLNYPSSNHQPETFVTKHDLELLHKKIIATDLIVQKYQEANKALLRLQVENDDLKQRIDQMENECSIFGKQVTECTQESDHLKRQIELMNNEKIQLNQQIRALQDENTNNQHEIMVLRQFESLKDTNDQLTKTVEKQQKMISKLQLQVQRKSPVVYKPNKNSQEPSETEIALTKSQKSVLELKLALGRLMNFIELSKIEIPTSIHIRPVLKAHEINDNFLETERIFVHKPVKKVLKPVINQDDSVDGNSMIPAALPVNKPAVIQTEKKPKKSRRKKVESISENEKLDALANELEIALAKSDQEHPSQISSFFTDDEEIPVSDKQQQQPVHNTQSTISFFTDDDDDDDEASKELIPPTSLIEPSISTLQVDHITPMDVQIPDKSINYMSFLSEDDEDNTQTVSTQEYISPVIEVQKSPLESSDKPLSSKESTEMKKDSLSNKEDQRIESTITINKMDPKHREIVFRLLKFLTQLPVPLKPLRLARRRIQPNATLQEQLHLSTDDEHLETPPIEMTQSSTNIEQVDVVLKPPTIAPTQPSINIQEIDEILEASTMKTAQPSARIEEVDVVLKPPTIEILQLSTNIKKVDVVLETPTMKMTQPSARIEEVDVVLKPPTIEILQLPTNIKEVDVVLETPMYVADEVREQQSDVEHCEIETTKVPEHLEQQNAFENPGEILQADSTTVPADDLHKDINSSQNEVLLPPEEQQNNVEINEVQLVTVTENLTTGNIDTTSKVAQDNQQILTEDKSETKEPDPMIKEVRKEQKTPVETKRSNESVAIITKSSTRPKPQEFTPLIKRIQSKPQLEQRLSSLVKKKPSQSSLTSFQISVINRLLHTLTTLPITPLHLPKTFPRRNLKRKSVVTKPSISSRPARTSRSPTRVQTRSLTSIRTRIARCNQQPTIIQRKRTTTEINTSPIPTTKRKKTNEIEQYDLINKYLQSFSKEIKQQLREFFDEIILDTNISSFIDRLYQILSDLLFEKCDMIIKLVDKLHSYEESIQSLLEYINSKSSRFQEYFIKKLNEKFQFEIKQSQISIKRIQILNRLLIITCSISPSSSSSSITIYARLFDIGYSLSHDILVDILTFISNIYPSFISANSQTNSSNILLHQILIDLSKDKTLPITFDYLHNLLLSYRRYTHDQEDLLRCFILIFRFRDWSWCSNEFYAKILYPLLNQTNVNSQRIIILMILQYLLFAYKINEDFQQDHRIHQQIKQQLKKLKTMNQEECDVREKICSLLSTCC